MSSVASTSVWLRTEVESENVGWDIMVTPANMLSVHGVELLQRKKCTVNTTYNQSLTYLNK